MKPRGPFLSDGDLGRGVRVETLCLQDGRFPRPYGK